ncbi:hypothetical protein D9M68_728580 [compost metagenome]
MQRAAVAPRHQAEAARLARGAAFTGDVAGQGQALQVDPRAVLADGGATGCRLFRRFGGAQGAHDAQSAPDALHGLRRLAFAAFVHARRFGAFVLQQLPQGVAARNLELFDDSGFCQRAQVVAYGLIILVAAAGDVVGAQVEVTFSQSPERLPHALTG